MKKSKISLFAEKAMLENKDVLMSVKQKNVIKKTLLLGIKVGVIFVCASITFYQTKECLVRYMQRSSAQTFNVLPSADTVFPALTICPSYGDAYIKPVLAYYGISPWDYRNGEFFGNASERTRHRAEAIFNAVTLKLDVLVQSFELRTHTEDRKYIQLPLNNQKMKEKNLGKWIHLRHQTYGKCYSLNISQEVTNLGVSVATIKTTKDSYVFLHYPGHFYDYDTGARGFSKLGKMYFVEADYSISVDELGAARNKCEPLLVGIYDECAVKELKTAMLNEIQCTAPWIPFPRICKDYYYNGTGETHVVKLYNKLAKEMLRAFCQLPCSSMQFVFGWPDEAKSYDENIGFLRIYFDSGVVVKTTILDYTWLSMLAEVGGYVGLFLGVAVVDLAPLMHTMVQTILDRLLY